MVLKVRMKSELMVIFCWVKIPTKEQVAGVTKEFQKRSKVPGMLMNVSFPKQLRLGIEVFVSPYTV